jgi:hypothetical protein
MRIGPFPLLVLGWLLLASAAGQAALVEIPYSGQLVDNGTPMSGWHQVSVSLWDAPAGGTLLHGQSGTVFVEQGVFHLALQVNDGVFASHDAVWVGVGVDGAPELEPRVRIGAVPYAVRALGGPAPPGVAFATGFQEIQVPASFNWTPIASVTLDAPADGQVWLTATGWWQEGSNTFPNYISVMFILGEGSPPPIDQMQQYYGFFELRSWPFSHTTVRPANAGSHTYTCWVQVNAVGVTLSAPPSFWPATMQALWVPNDYGN